MRCHGGAGEREPAPDVKRSQYVWCPEVLAVACGDGYWYTSSMKVAVFIKEKFLHPLFELGVVIKTIDGIAETAIGFLVLFLSGARINGVFTYFARGELLEDPHDAFINFLAGIFHSVSTDAKTFAAIYILLHGVINICLVVGLYKQKLWAYLATMATITIFIMYQIYRVSLYHSQGLAILSVFDALFLILTWNEYRYHRNKKEFKYT